MPCSTLGLVEAMRTPLPAARTTTRRGCLLIAPRTLSKFAERPANLRPGGRGRGATDSNSAQFPRWRTDTTTEQGATILAAAVPPRNRAPGATVTRRPLAGGLADRRPGRFGIFALAEGAPLEGASDLQQAMPLRSQSPQTAPGTAGAPR